MLGEAKQPKIPHILGASALVLVDAQGIDFFCHVGRAVQLRTAKTPFALLKIQTVCHAGRVAHDETHIVNDIEDIVHAAT